ncbi:MAG: carbonic anhydrase [Acidobacteriota bacterium]
MRVFAKLLVSVLLLGDTEVLPPGSQPSPEAVLAILRDGNSRFAADRPQYPHEGAARRAETSSGQHPVATVIACSDSRVPPEILFDEGIGDLFVIRTAGNVAGVHEIASAEYAVEHVGTPLLVVLGHTACGAVTAVVTHAELHGNLSSLVSHIKPAVALARKEHPGLQTQDLVSEAVRANVLQTIEELFKKSRIIRESVNSGHLKVVGAVYDIKGGQVQWLGTHPRQRAFVSK